MLTFTTSGLGPEHGRPGRRRPRGVREGLALRHERRQSVEETVVVPEAGAWTRRGTAEEAARRRGGAGVTRRGRYG